MTELAEVTSRVGTTTPRTGSARSSCTEAVRATPITSGRRKSAKTFAVVSVSRESVIVKDRCNGVSQI